MEYRINISSEAERDIQKALCYYKMSNLESAFSSDFINQIEYLKSNPFLFQLYYKKVRRIHFSKFNYSIHYFVEEDVVYILRILHVKQYTGV
ncbi:type II toxin-antitoxin system RelE/ParE family toxin [Galbibacter mesophilus]|uniref:type II toxin-antitoxin system RelE/ParE family toxin n=1 Tax=Galbibacter mesophilus TaxID=379069 RepID=UPI00191F63DA